MLWKTYFPIHQKGISEIVRERNERNGKEVNRLKIWLMIFTKLMDFLDSAYQCLSVLLLYSYINLRREHIQKGTYITNRNIVSDIPCLQRNLWNIRKKFTQLFIAWHIIYTACVEKTLIFRFWYVDVFLNFDILEVFGSLQPIK